MLNRNGTTAVWKIMIAAAVALATAGCSLLPEEEQALKPPLVKPVKEKVETAEVKRGTIAKMLKGVGTFESYEITYHETKQSGLRVSEVLVKAGDTVKKGDLLIQLENEGLELVAKQKMLEVEKKKLALQELQSKEGDQSTQDQAKLRIAALELEIAEEQLRMAQEDLANRRILSKADGVITFLAEMRPGDKLDAYTVLAAVSDQSKLRIAYSTSAANDLQAVSVGMEAKVKIGTSEVAGSVVQTPSSAPFTEDKRLAEAYSRSLYISLPRLPEGAGIGKMADLSITLQSKENVLVIPNRAVRTYLGRTYVQLLDGESRKEIDIQKGIETQTETEVLEGIKEGQQVILQ
ncbi:efflux RND transporter periplasmic adaptor subunit [Paenibacillus turpanensis]|uniref:efflux RND transporter periplasmic adaptor subunit n=1 Tax=Paenibacillus turpanensis TaxID=2689078 RepID=UPI001409FBE7|nr:biotin/lipoyl-binding protein [Paenibacillus turpanensis]